MDQEFVPIGPVDTTTVVVAGYVQQQPGGGGYVQQPITQPPVADTHIHVSTDSRMGVWSSGLCGCLTSPIGCLCACCCPVCYSCFISDKLGESICLPCCVPGYLTTLRSVMRTRHNIPGSVMGDCCITCWCQCCAVTQMSRHHDFAANRLVSTNATVITGS